MADERARLIVLSGKASPTDVASWLYEESVCGLTKAAFLWIANGVCFLAHVGLAVTTVVMATRDGKGMDTPTLAIYRTNLTWYANSTTNALVPSVQAVEGLQLAWMTLSFFLLSAAAHGLVLLGNWRQAFAANDESRRALTRWSGFYFVWVSQARNPLRWTEYAFSASVMIMTISVASGVNMVNELTCIFVLMTLTMYFGYATEVLSPIDGDDLGPGGKPQRWAIRDDTLELLTIPELPAALQRLAPHLLGYIPYGTAYGLILYTFISNSTDGDGQGAPTFVWIIVISQFAVFTVFGLLQFFSQAFESGPKYYFWVEFGYCLLSILAKGILGGTLISSVLIYSSFEEAAAAAS